MTYSKSLVAAALCLALTAGAEDKPALNMPEAIQQVSLYEFGQSRSALIHVENAAQDAIGKPEAGELEKSLLGILANEAATADGKRFACRMLGLVGGQLAADKLGELLANPEYFGQALQALEAYAPRNVDYADAVLSRTAPTLGPDQQASIIDCMARYKSNALAAMAPAFLASESATVRGTMASALGKAGTADACAALAAHFLSEGVDRTSLHDGCLSCLPVLTESNAKQGIALLDALASADTPAAVRAQAYLRAVNLPAFEDAELEAARQAALAKADADADIEMVRARIVLLEKNPEGAAGLAQLLDNPDPQVQVYALAALARRKDASAVGAIAAKLAGDNAEVRSSAFRALIASASDEAFDPLYALATSEDKDRKRPALEALTALAAPGANAKLAALAQGADPIAQVFALNLLGARRALDTHDVIRTAADAADATVFEAAHGALRVVGKEEDLPTLLDAALNPADAARAKEYQSTVVAIAARQADDKQVALLTERLAAATDPAQRATLLALVGRVGGKAALDLLVANAADADGGVRTAVAKALGEWNSIDALAPLAKLLSVESGGDAASAAFDGVVKLMRDAKLPANEAMNYVQALRKAAQTDSDRRKLLQVISSVTDLRAFRIAESLVKEEALVTEAEQALVDLGTRLAGGYPKEVQARMIQIARTSKRDPIKAAAQDVSKAINGFGDFLTSWAVSGPYKIEGKRAHELYDVRFAPEDGLKCEDPISTGHLGWEVMPAAVTPSIPGYVNLQKEFMENECVAYLRCCFNIEAAQIGKLEVGSDDGCKIWVDGELRVTDVGMRHYVPGESVCLMELSPGEHTIVVAVYEHASDWGFSAKLTTSDGGKVVTLLQAPPVK
jgi:HEAT repeat protein